ncbi:hypothetical protein RND81_10G039400 [Saponaria officinalis]|uniref:Glutaredoxin domain-containing protein n=1 Tax=Saponaria officinalis TaxID=3572 RepID=A0AAW1HXM7_SAPOF
MPWDTTKTPISCAQNGKPVDTLEGADPSSLANKVAKVVGSVNPDEPAAPARFGLAAGPSILEGIKNLAQNNEPFPIENQPSSGHIGDLNEELKQLINSKPIMLFMKGNPEEPKCGFNLEVIDILKKEKVPFGTFDILTNQKVRKGLNKFSNWPTYPQLYLKGELLGGCDIITDMHTNGQLKDVFRDFGIETTDSIKGSTGNGNGDISSSTGLSSSFTSRLVSLIAFSPVMLFMKGEPEQPKCGFSRKVVEILQQEKVSFKSFDILTDDEVRQGLKVYSNWFSYPQLYTDNEFIGGSDIEGVMAKIGTFSSVYQGPGLFDHTPCIIQVKGAPSTRRRSFKYFNMWSGAADFIHCVQEGWNHPIRGTKMYCVVKKMKALKRSLKILNRSLFADVENNAIRAGLYLDFVQEHVKNYPTNAEWTEKELSAAATYSELRKACDSFLLQKSKAVWTSEGDNNIKYFHSVIKGRQIQNKILRIRDIRGKECVSPKDIQNAFLEFYTGLLGTSQPLTRINMDVVQKGKLSTQEHARLLLQPISRMDVKRAVFSILK